MRLRALPALLTPFVLAPFTGLGCSGDGGAADAGAADATAADALTAPTDGGPSLADLSDEFESGALSTDWQIIRPEAADLRVTGGALELSLKTSVLWFNADRGVLLSKPVTGDFIATTAVSVRMRSDPSAPPASTIHLAGIMARAGDAPSEDYVFIVTGRDENDLSVETKSTDDSVSTYQGPSWPSSDAQLRLCRIGARFVFLKRPLAGGAWEIAQAVERADLPATLDVGANAYAFLSGGGVPDFLARFERVAFDLPASEADCTRE